MAATAKRHRDGDYLYTIWRFNARQGLFQYGGLDIWTWTFGSHAFRRHYLLVLIYYLTTYWWHGGVNNGAVGRRRRMAPGGEGR